MKKLSGEAFDRKFDNNEDINDYVDWGSAQAFPAKHRREVTKINLDLTRIMLGRIDEEAARIGVPRQSLLKVWISERLDQEAKKHA